MTKACIRIEVVRAHFTLQAFTLTLLRTISEHVNRTVLSCINKMSFM